MFQIYRAKIIICSAISVVILGIVGRKFYLKKKQERDDRTVKETLDRARRERRAKSRPQNLNESQLCVVCTINPKEVIILKI